MFRIFTFIPSPYQRQTFRALFEADLIERVFYLSGHSFDRKWPRSDLWEFEEILRGCVIDISSQPYPLNFAMKLPPPKNVCTIVSGYTYLFHQFMMRLLHAMDRRWVFWGERPGLNGNKNVLRGHIRRHLQGPLGSANAIVAMGTVSKISYEQLFPSQSVFNIPYFCDLENFRRASLMASRDCGEICILFSGQLVQRKGVDILIRAFVELCRQTGPIGQRLRLSILGDGPERETLRRLVPSDIERQVDFLGHRRQADLPSIFASSDIFCLPSRHDGWGLVVNEALASGLPIVVSDAVGAGFDLVENGRNGLVTSTDDVASLRRALVELVCSEKLRRDMSIQSSRIAESWGLDEAVRRWREVHEHVFQRD